MQHAAQDFKFNATLKPRIDAAIEDWHATQPPNIQPPIISSDELRISAPWLTDDEHGTDHT